MLLFYNAFYGGLKDLKYSPRVIRHLCCPSDNSDHFPCLVNCYAKYLESVKSLSVKTDGFYFRPNSDSAKFCFDNVPVGMNSLNKILPDKLCGEAGLTRKTSHSLRVTCATTLFQNLVEEKLIRERTGHRSNALYKYEKTNVDQLRKVSEILGPPQSFSENQKCDEEVMEATE